MTGQKSGINGGNKDMTKTRIRNLFILVLSVLFAFSIISFMATKTAKADAPVVIKSVAEVRMMEENSDGKNGKNQPRDITEMLPEAPEGYVAVIIEKGISNEDYTEVKSRLSEGQEIYRQSAATGNNSMMGMMGGMPMGGGMSGGMPMGGGMSGGMGGRPGGMR